ncbi:MAG: HAD hydrolase-like protein [Bacilli bacterium]
MKKSDPEFCRIARRKFGLAPQEVLLVDDHLKNEIRPADSLGMKTVWAKQGVSRVEHPFDKTEIPSISVREITKIASLLL